LLCSRPKSPELGEQLRIEPAKRSVRLPKRLVVLRGHQLLAARLEILADLHGDDGAYHLLGKTRRPQPSARRGGPLFSVRPRRSGASFDQRSGHQPPGFFFANGAGRTRLALVVPVELELAAASAGRGINLNDVNGHQGGIGRERPTTSSVENFMGRQKDGGGRKQFPDRMTSRERPKLQYDPNLFSIGVVRMNSV